MPALQPWEVSSEALQVRDLLPSSAPKAARVGYLLVAMLTTAVTTSLCASRMRTIHNVFGFNQMRPIHYITACIYLLGISFAVSAAVINFGFGINGPSECEALIVICLSFYFGQKAMVYLFLVERTRVVRGSKASHRDWVYLFGLVIVVAGFVIVAVIAFIHRAHEFDPEEGTCHIGVPSRVALAFLTYDIAINLFLTSVFLYYVRPYFTGSFSALFLPGPHRHSDPTQTVPSVIIPQIVLRKVIRKTFWGCVFMLPTTIANLTILFAMKGRQQAWFCLTMCTLDVLWGTIVTHWLTSNPEEGSQLSRTRGSLRDPAIRAPVKQHSRNQNDLEFLGIRREIKITCTTEVRDPDNDSTCDVSITAPTSARLWK